jgi:O-antigen/teichoic acid export membrane protein
MKKRVQSIIFNPLFSSSMVVIVGSNIVNALNYIYHLIIGRLLGPTTYGELASLISIIGLLGIIPGALGMTIVKFISSAKEKDEVDGLVKWLTKLGLVIGIIEAIIIIFSSSMLKSFLKIDDISILLLVSLSIFIATPVQFYRSVLQGLLKFNQMVLSVLADSGLKLLGTVLLVYLGFGLLGTIVGMIIGISVGLIIAIYSLREYLNFKYEKALNLKPILSYSIPIIIQTGAQTSLYSADLILVKHFFNPHDAGLYASLSVLGRIIFFGAGPVASVMFPMISKKKAAGESYNRVFSYSLLLTSAISLFVLLIYLFFPELAIQILYGKLYLDAASYLVWFGLFMCMFTIATLLVNYNFALGKTKVVIFPSLAALLQILGIWIFHSDLKEVITISIIVSCFLLVSLFFYTYISSKN